MLKPFQAAANRFKHKCIVVHYSFNCHRNLWLGTCLVKIQGYDMDQQVQKALRARSQRDAKIDNKRKRQSDTGVVQESYGLKR